jgi:hypothetical protein
MKRQKSIDILKLKYLMNKYYSKSKIYKGMKLSVTTFLPILMIFYKKFDNIKLSSFDLEYFLLVTTLVIYIISKKGMEINKKKAANAHRCMDYKILNIDSFKEGFEFPINEFEKKLVNRKEIYPASCEHYDALDISNGSRYVTEFEGILNIQQNNLISTLKTKIAYLNFNCIFLLAICFFLILISGITGIDEDRKAIIIGFIPIIIILIDEVFSLQNENKEIEKYIDKIEGIKNKLDKEYFINNVKDIQKFIDNLRSEYIEVPSFIYIYLYEIKRLSVLNKIERICIYPIMKFLFKVFKLVFDWLSRKIIYLLDILLSKYDNFNKLKIKVNCKFKKKYLLWEQKYLELESSQIFEETLLYKKLLELRKKYSTLEWFVVGSVANRIIVDLDLDIHIKSSKSEFCNIKNELSKLKCIENEVDNKYYWDFNYNEFCNNSVWNIDIRLSYEDEYLGIKHLKKYQNRINDLDKIKIIEIKTLMKEKLIPKLPSIYIYII